MTDLKNKFEESVRHICSDLESGASTNQEAATAYMRNRWYLLPDLRKQMAEQIERMLDAAQKRTHPTNVPQV